MKRISMVTKVLGTVLALIMLASLSVTVVADETNLMPNPGMESDTAGEEWKTFTGTYVQGTTVPTTAEYSTGEHFEGTRSLKLTGTGGTVSAYQQLYLQAGVTYEVSAYIKIASLTGTGLKAKVTRMHPGDASVIGTSGLFTAVSNEWKKVIFLVKSDPSLNFYGQKSSLVFELTGTGTVYIDNAVLKQSSGLMYNGDCEGCTSEGKLPLFAADAGAVLSQGDGGVNGGKCLVVNGTGAASGLPYAYFDVTTTPGTTLKVSFWAKNDGSIPPYIQWTAGSETKVSWSPALFTAPAANTWVYYECNYTVPSSSSIFRIMFRTAAKKTTYYDEISITVQESEINFYSGTTKIDSLQTGAITAKLTYVPESGETVNSAVLIVGLYNENPNGSRTLVGINTAPLQESKTGLFNLSASVNVDSLVNKTIRAYLWKGLSEPEPLLDIVTLQ